MVFDGEAFGQQMVDIVRGYVAAELDPLREQHKALLDANAALRDRIDALEARELLLPEKGEPGRDGKDADVEEIKAFALEAIAEAVPSAVKVAFDAAPLPEKGDTGERGADGVDGKDVDIETVKALLASTVADVLPDIVKAAVDVLPTPEKGEKGDPGERGADGAPGEPGQDGKDGRDGAGIEAVEVVQDEDLVELSFAIGGDTKVYQIQLPPGPAGPEGKVGKLTAAKAWADEVHYEGVVRTHSGGTWQALKDTAKEPPHEDWICIAAPGANGSDGQSLNPRRLWDADETYQRLDVVARNGGSFVALRDGPGVCPGEGWMLLTSPGKRGEKGERGEKADRGPPGPAGPGIAEMVVSNDGLLALTNADGSQVACDLYPLLSKIDRH